MHPAKYFIRYLMTVGDKGLHEDNQLMRSTLEQLGLFEKIATDDVLNSIREEVKIPSDYMPGSKKHKNTIMFQKSLKVRDMHAMTLTCKKANELRENPAAREFAEQLLLSRSASFAEVARRVNEECHTFFKKQDIATFYHYFFNVEMIPLSVWADAIKKRRSIGYKSALLGDKRLVLWRRGGKVNIDTHEALEETFTQAHMRLMEMRLMPTNLATMNMFQRGAETIVRVHQAMAESEVRMKEVLKQLEQFKQSRRDTVIPDIKELGEHTGSKVERNITPEMLLPAPKDFN